MMQLSAVDEVLPFNRLLLLGPLCKSWEKGRLSRKGNGNRGKLVRTCEQKVNKEEKLTLTFHRNLLILLGELSLR